MEEPSEDRSTELMVDRVAQQTGQDPLQFRLDNAKDDRMKAVIRKVAEIAAGPELVVPGTVPAEQGEPDPVDRAGHRLLDPVVDQEPAPGNSHGGRTGADALLRLFGRAADMRSQDDILQALQRRYETLRVRARLDRKDVDERRPASDLRPAPGTRRRDRTFEPGPVGVIAEHEAAIHRLQELVALDITRALSGKGPRKPVPQ